MNVLRLVLLIWAGWNSCANPGRELNLSHGEGFQLLGFFLGDDVQLPPVLDCPVYKCNAKSQASMHGSLVWKEFNAAVLLSTVIRQGEDQTQFKNVLSSVREYKLSSDQAKWLQNYQWDDLKKNNMT